MNTISIPPPLSVTSVINIEVELSAFLTVSTKTENG